LKLKKLKINRFFYLTKWRNIMAGATAVTLPGTTLDQVQKFTSDVVRGAESVLKTTTDALSTGGAMSMESMLKYQAEISKYTLTGQLMATIGKELIDALKTVINKIG
jgi:hypothetical protein